MCTYPLDITSRPRNISQRSMSEKEPCLVLIKNACLDTKVLEATFRKKMEEKF